MSDAPQREMIPPGRYIGTLTSGAIGVSGKQDKPAACLTFQVQDQVRTVYLYLTDAALPYTEPKLAALGFNGDYENPAFSKTEGVSLVCKHEEYEGKVREKWDLGFLPKPADKSTLANLSAKFRARHGTPPRPTAPPPSAPSKTPPPPKKPEVEHTLEDDGKWNKDRAWEKWIEAYPDPKVCEKKFLAAVGKQEKAAKHDEDEFTSADWRDVAELGEIPF